MNAFQLPGDPATVWPRLLDVEDVAICMPGATVKARDGDGAYDIQLQVALGPMRLIYKGDLTVERADEATRTLVLAAKVKEARGGGRAEATVTTTLATADADAGTDVAVATDLQISGRAAQMGGNVIDDVARHMTEQFATCLQGRMSASAQPTPAPEAGASDAPASTPATGPAPPRPVGGLRLLLTVLRGRLARLFGR